MHARIKLDSDARDDDSARVFFFFLYERSNVTCSLLVFHKLFIVKNCFVSPN